MNLRGLIIITCLVGLVLFCARGAQATSVFFPDDYTNWPGYPVPPYSVILGDQIGIFPTVTGATITYDANNILQSIAVHLTNPRDSETLFINAQWDRINGEPYDRWDYFIRGGRFYAVSPSFTPSDYILVSGEPQWRLGHPFAIDPGMLTAQPGYLVSAQYLPNTADLVYTFGPNQIQLFTANTSFVIGFSQDCGNDVLLISGCSATGNCWVNTGLVSVTKSGSGSGTVTSSPSGIDCNTTCAASFASGTVAILTATPDAGSVFISWTGCDAVNGNVCTVTMEAARSVTALFSSVMYADFESDGTWMWNGSNWSKLTYSNPENMVASGSFLYADFGSDGTWMWNGSNWMELTYSNPEKMMVP